MAQSAVEPLKTARIEFPDNDKVRALCGAHSEHLKLIEKRLGVQLGLRGGQIVVAAAEEARVRLAEQLLKELYDLVVDGYPLYLEDVDQATKLAGQGVALKEIFGDTVFVSSRHRVITPKGLAQKRYIQAIRDDDIVFGVGPAGTGKTYLAVAMAVNMLKTGRARRMILARPADVTKSYPSLLPVARRARNALLVRPPVAVGSARMRLFAKSTRFHPRGALVAEVTTGDARRFTAIVVHLGLSGEERVRHAKELLSLTAIRSRPFLLGGDLNENPGGPAATTIASVARDVWTGAGVGEGATFPSNDPAARIDYLFASEDVGIRNALVPREAALKEASDHLPLVVDLAL